MPFIALVFLCIFNICAAVDGTSVSYLGPESTYTEEMAPIRKYLNQGLNIGLGSDIAGGHSGSIFQAITEKNAAGQKVL